MAVLWIVPGNKDPDDYKDYPLTKSEAATKIIFFQAIATIQNRGLNININKFIEGIKDYVMEYKEGF